MDENMRRPSICGVELWRPVESPVCAAQDGA
jgi:hypothetical protein